LLVIFKQCSIKRYKIGVLDAITASYSGGLGIASSASVRSALECNTSVLCVFCAVSIPCLTYRSTLMLCVVASCVWMPQSSGYCMRTVYTSDPNCGLFHHLYITVCPRVLDRTTDVDCCVDPNRNVFCLDVFLYCGVWHVVDHVLLVWWD